MLSWFFALRLSGVTECDFKDNVLLGQGNHSTEIPVWFCIMPDILPKPQQIFSHVNTNGVRSVWKSSSPGNPNAFPMFAPDCVTAPLITHSTEVRRSPVRKRMHNHCLTGLLAVLQYNINIPFYFLSICPAVFSQQGGWGADGILKPGWTWELEAAVNGDICLAHWLMSERSPRVIRLQRNFLHGWHSSLREETTKDTLGRGWGWDVRSQIVEVGAVPRGMWLSHHSVF